MNTTGILVKRFLNTVQLRRFSKFTMITIFTDISQSTNTEAICTLAVSTELHLSHTALPDSTRVDGYH